MFKDLFHTVQLAQSVSKYH